MAMATFLRKGIIPTPENQSIDVLSLTVASWGPNSPEGAIKEWGRRVVNRTEFFI
jgi:hypothetical protein